MEQTFSATLARTPLYMQLYGVLSRRISDGVFPENSYIPNEYDLTREFKVSIGTVRKAVDLLVRDRLVIRQQGKGTIVADSRWGSLQEKLNRLRHTDESLPVPWNATELEFTTGSMQPAIALKLALPVESPIHIVRRLLRSEPRTVELETAYFPSKLFPVTSPDELEQHELIGLAAMNNHVIGRVEERIMSVIASEKGAQIMGIDMGSPLLKTERLVFEKRGYALQFRISYAYLPDGFFLINME